MTIEIKNFKVSCYSGYRGEETPRSFELEGKIIEVQKVIFQWKTPGERHFKIEGSDGKIYVLTHDEENWHVTQENK